MKQPTKDTGTKHTGTYKAKNGRTYSNARGMGGRSHQLLDRGVPPAVVGEIARAHGDAPGQAHYHGGLKPIHKK